MKFVELVWVITDVRKYAEEGKNNFQEKYTE